MLISQKIEDIICSCTDSRAVIGKFLLQEQANLERCSMRDIAAATYTSQATLVRFAKRIGFPGWTEFMKAYLREVQYFESRPLDVDFNFPFTSKDGCEQILKTVAKVRRDANRDTINLMSVRELESAAMLLRRADRIMLCSNSANIPLLQMFQQKMLRIGKIVESIGQDEQAFMAYALTPKDCVIMVSYSGNSEKRIPTSLLQPLKERGIPIIGITSMGDNLIRQYADYVFMISTREKLYFKIASFATEESISVILDALYASYFAADYNAHLEHKRQASQRIETRRSRTAVLRTEQVK